LVIDDDEQVHQLFRFCFSEEYDVRFACSVPETLAMVERDEFPVVMLDLNLHGKSGLEILPDLRKKNHLQKIIILTGYASQQSAISAVNQGAFKYLEKPFAISEIRDAIEEGFALYSKERSGESEKAYSKSELVSLGLSRKEAEIVHWVVKGETNLEIAARLALSRRTIEKYTENIFAKLNVNSRMKLGKCLRELRGSIIE
jgi:FixJ family two-component response regulator